ncbi:MAG: HDIG domain-containing protein [Desulfobacterales bacterium]|nr:HDIG domain-containing protein [Desulfobacterales bacterium]
MIDPIAIIRRYYPEGSRAGELLIAHGLQVAQKALDVAERLPHLALDPAFIETAARLHDIGMFLTHAPAIGCHGKHPYIRHGILGRELLEREGLPVHALVCERHVGAGISAGEIRRGGLPLPQRDMIPMSMAEQIICYADKFFSKNGNLDEKPLDAVLASVAPYGQAQIDRFRGWVETFESLHPTKNSHS